MPPVIQLTGITRHYEMGGETVAALDGVDLMIERGEMVAIMGPSGSGNNSVHLLHESAAAIAP